MAAAKYKVFTYDLWADGDGGWSVNDVWSQGTYELDPDAPTFLDEVCDAAGLRRGMVEVDQGVGGCETTYFVWTEAANGVSEDETYEGYPACEIRLVEET